MKLMGFFCQVITTCKDIQLDPPESQIMHQISASMIFASKDSLIMSGLYDGVIKSIVT